MNREQDDDRDLARTAEQTRHLDEQARGITQVALSGLSRFISSAIESSVRTLEEHRFAELKMPPTGCKNLLPDLTERLNKDVAIYQSIEGLQPERWKRADFIERMQTLLSMETHIAADQGRTAYLVGPQLKRHMPESRQRATQILAATSHPFTESMEAKDLNGLSQREDGPEGHLRVILMERKCVMKQPLEKVFHTMAKEIFHAFQHDVLDRPTAYSFDQVSLQRRALWAWGQENKASLTTKNQPFEIDAKLAADYARARLFR